MAPQGVFHLTAFSGKVEWSIYQRSTAKKLKLLLLLHLPPELDQWLIEALYVYSVPAVCVCVCDGSDLEQYKEKETL